MPLVDVYGKQYTTGIRGIQVAYEYSIQDIRASMMAGGMPLDVRRAQAAKNVVGRTFDKLVAAGDSTRGLIGFADTANGMSQTNIIAKPNTGHDDWYNANGSGVGATPAQVYDDLNACALAVFKQSNGLHTPDTIAMDVNSYAYMCTKPQSPTFTYASILQFFLQTHPWIKTIKPWARLNNAGASSVSRLVCYKKDPDCLEQLIPQPFEQFAPQAKGLVMRIHCHARHGGLQVRRPLSMTYMDGTYAGS